MAVVQPPLKPSKFVNYKIVNLRCPVVSQQNGVKAVRRHKKVWIWKLIGENPETGNVDNPGIHLRDGAQICGLSADRLYCTLL